MVGDMMWYEKRNREEDIKLVQLLYMSQRRETVDSNLN